MKAQTHETFVRIVGHPAPRDLEWTEFESLWADIADDVEQKSGGRLAVKLNGHREVFHRQHDSCSRTSRSSKATAAGMASQSKQTGTASCVTTSAPPRSPIPRLRCTTPKHAPGTRAPSRTSRFDSLFTVEAPNCNEERDGRSDHNHSQDLREPDGR